MGDRRRRLREGGCTCLRERGRILISTSCSLHMGAHVTEGGSKSMTHGEYMREVAAGRWPEDPVVPVPEQNLESVPRGINNVCQPDREGPMFGGAAIIDSHAGQIRSNHYHLTDWHFLRVLSGVMVYMWRPARSASDPSYLVVQPGGTVFTPPEVEHLCYFPGEASVLSLSRLSRRTEEHEADLVRVRPLAAPARLLEIYMVQR